jgi:threonine dehydrogenase-like Zn-dependent dehydrogenase
MKAVVYAGPDRIELVDRPRPRVVERDDAVVEVEITSICGSDLHLLDGKTPGMRVGSTIGHEFTGIVVDAGADVRDVKPGDRVVGSFVIACGQCSSCRARRFNFCERRAALGLGTLAGDLDGAQAEYVRVPHADCNLLKVPWPRARLAPEIAFLCGDVLATGFYASSLATGEAVRASDARIVVFGAGPIGLACAYVLRYAGRPPILIDPDPARISFAAGAGFAVEADAARYTAGGVADVAIEAVGSIPALKAAMRSVRDGGRIVVLGVYGQERYALPMGVAWVRGLDLRFAGMANVHAHWAHAMQALAHNEIDPAPMITHRLRLEDASEAYELFRSRQAIKIALAP